MGLRFFYPRHEARFIRAKVNSSVSLPRIANRAKWLQIINRVSAESRERNNMFNNNRRRTAPQTFVAVKGEEFFHSFSVHLPTTFLRLAL